MKKILPTLSLALVAVLALPGQVLANQHPNPLAGYITSIGTFINNTVIPALIALAFLVLVYGIFQNFFLGRDDEEAREKGKQLILYSVIGMLLIVSVWGIVALLSGALGLNQGGGGIVLPKIFQIQ